MSWRVTHLVTEKLQINNNFHNRRHKGWCLPAIPLARMMEVAGSSTSNVKLSEAGQGNENNAPLSCEPGDDLTQLSKKDVMVEFHVHRRSDSQQKPCTAFKRNNFSSLPDEILLEIFSHLPQSKLNRFLVVSKRWKRIAEDKTLWHTVDFFNKKLTVGLLGRILARGTRDLNLASSFVRRPIFLQAGYIFRLESLNLRVAKITKDDLCSLLAACPQLKKLDLTHLAVNRKVCRFVSRLRNLDQLIMRHCQGVSDTSILFICRGCLKLTKWNLAFLTISETLVKILVAEIPVSIEHLVLCSYFNMSMQDIDFQKLVSRCPNITYLDIGVAHFLTAETADSLLRLKKLTTVILGSCKNIPVTTLLSLRELKNLKVLNFECDHNSPSKTEKGMLREGLPGVEIY